MAAIYDASRCEKKYMLSKYAVKRRRSSYADISAVSDIGINITDTGYAASDYDRNQEPKQSARQRVSSTPFNYDKEEVPLGIKRRRSSSGIGADPSFPSTSKRGGARKAQRQTTAIQF